MDQDHLLTGPQQPHLKDLQQAQQSISERGLYKPEFDHDACGVGVVANIKGIKSHDIVRKALQVLSNLEHRGAECADPETGDGAGVLLQMPDAFFRRVAKGLGVALPPPGDYAVGMVFLPRDPALRARCEHVVEETVAEEGQRWLGWRDVPVDPKSIGWMARDVMPMIRQCFVGRGNSTPDSAALERKTYVIRKVIEAKADGIALPKDEDFYLPSLSTNRIVFKGLLQAHQIERFYLDLGDEDVVSAFGLVHSRFSTNTLGSWRLAHPYRMIAHNGEINTLRGNINWMRSREALFSSPLFGDDIKKVLPVIRPNQSDTACLDNALELLLNTGRSLPHAMLMLIPEACGDHIPMPQDKRDFYEYHACIMEPWDGPALVAFTDGHSIGAILDRNGLRPFRYLVTSDDLLVMASETGVLDVPPEQVRFRARLEPGRMFYVDFEQGRIVADEEVKHTLAKRQPYGRWLRQNVVDLRALPRPEHVYGNEFDTLVERQRAFGYTQEDVQHLMEPMAQTGQEPTGSMGNDAALAVLSERPQPLFNYFRQLFAQVTNPPLDAIREELVTSVMTVLGPEHNLFEETPLHARQFRIHEPILSNEDLERVRGLRVHGLRTKQISTLFDPEEGPGCLQRAVERVRNEAAQALKDGYGILLLSDRGMAPRAVPIPSLLATAAVHHHLIRQGMRSRCGMVVESGEPREVHHFALLIGYGAGAVNPYLALETVADLARRRRVDSGVNEDKAQKNFLKAMKKGVVKVMSKMGISTVQSYRGAQVFEAIGLSKPLIDEYFTWTPSRVGGLTIETLEEEVLRRHRKAYPERQTSNTRLELENPGFYYWRRNGENHMWNPESIAKLQHAARTGDYGVFKEFAGLVDNEERRRASLRGLLKFKKGQPIPLSEVEPTSDIVKRFATGAISLGSISREAHETLAIAMNRLGGRSNTGEGGEDPTRYTPDPNGDSRNSAIKQVASGRFGVTTNYLVNARDLQIKMAQGAKPGEGGQLPGHKVSDYIGFIRHTTPGVELISPPPHHDIYSIEDLAQLIHDLKNANPQARIHVKLVAEVGVGTIAAGVAKAHADVVLISGDNGGTGASPESSIKHAGLPWELGVAETQQVLVANGLRGRIVVQTDGQLKTGRDVAIAAMLGADEYGFGTASLITLGCVYLRKCHLNMCSVGIATQEPELRKNFAGKPEYLVNYFTFIAEHLREIMAELGFRTVNEMIGRTDMLDWALTEDHWKAKGLDLSPLLYRPTVPAGVATHQCESQEHGLAKALDHTMVRLASPALERKEPVAMELPIRNSNRAVAAMLSGEVAKRYADEGLPEDTIRIKFTGSAGQSFGAWLARGISLTVEGDTNDYIGKGLCGGRIVVYPYRNSTYVPEDNIIIGNVALYGATGGEAFFRGRAGERFCVRNSGANAVVEGIGDHGCEYMTGGRVVVIGPTGRNFAAGMSGGIAYVLDEQGVFHDLCNREMVELSPLSEESDIATVHLLVESHWRYTGSTVARRVLDNWERMVDKFVRVMPTAYKRVLEREREREKAAPAPAVTHG